MKIRINDLARELEIKSKAVLETLPLVGIVGKKTHSGSLSEEEANRVRKYVRNTNVQKYLAEHRHRSQANEFKTKFDLSQISKVGDVSRVLRKQQTPSTKLVTTELPTEIPDAWKPVPGQPIYRRKPSAVSAAKPPASKPSTAKQSAPKPSQAKPSPPMPRARTAEGHSSRTILPQTGPRPVYTVNTKPKHMTMGMVSSVSQTRSPHEDAIQEAEKALKALRTEEKQKTPARTKEY